MPDPTPPADFSALRTMTTAELLQIGCRLWDETGLVLFPAAWADSIPEGFEVRTINGTEERVSKSWPAGKFDRRMGVLAFGILPIDRAGTLVTHWPSSIELLETHPEQMKAVCSCGWKSGPLRTGDRVAEAMAIHLAEVAS